MAGISINILMTSGRRFIKNEKKKRLSHYIHPKILRAIFLQEIDPDNYTSWIPSDKMQQNQDWHCAKPDATSPIIAKFLVARKTIGNDRLSGWCNHRSINALAEYHRVSFDCINFGCYHSSFAVSVSFLSRFHYICKCDATI